jgi:hypothetical protein
MIFYYNKYFELSTVYMMWTDCPAFDAGSLEVEYI